MKQQNNFWLAAIALLLFVQTGIQLYSVIKEEIGIVAPHVAHHNGVPAIKSIPDLPKTAVSFGQVSHDFGVIDDSKKQYAQFKFKNTGTEPLLILSAEGSCGCTVPEWPKEAIAPGEEETIEVAFDPNGQLGEQAKIVTITANTEPTTTILTVKANIVKSG